MTAAHTHTYDQEVATPEHLKTEATCTSPAVYYKSCTCGANGTETFTSGSALGHAESGWKTSATEHWKVCTRADCGVEIPDSRASHADTDTDNRCDVCNYDMTPAHTHTYDHEVATAAYLKDAATCTTAAVYYKSCACGEKGTEIFTSGSALGHDYAAEWSSDATNHWHACTRCGDKTDNAAHVSSGPATATTPETCTVCGYVITPATGGGSSSGSGGGGGSSHSSRYTITVDKTENGTITVSPKSASKGDTVTVTVKPDKGYELDTLKVLDKDGDKVKITEKKGKYTFTMPASKVTVKGKFVEEAPEQIFADVPVDAYCYEAVKWAASDGITGGIGNNLFAPGRPCTRGQIVTFLWRAAGSPAPKSMSSFADVPADAYYAKAVAWAVENGITGGTGDGKFSPDATCTRAQAVTFLYRASGSPAVSGNSAFTDVAADAYYAAAVAWAEKNGVTGGIGNGLFGSGNNCTRAQIVTFLYRAMK